MSQLIGSSRNGDAVALKGGFQSVLLLGSKSQIFKTQINVSLKKRQLGWYLWKFCVGSHFYPGKHFAKLDTVPLAQ